MWATWGGKSKDYIPGKWISSFWQRTRQHQHYWACNSWYRCDDVYSWIGHSPENGSYIFIVNPDVLDYKGGWQQEGNSKRCSDNHHRRQECQNWWDMCVITDDVHHEWAHGHIFEQTGDQEIWESFPNHFPQLGMTRLGGMPAKPLVASWEWLWRTQWKFQKMWKLLWKCINYASSMDMRVHIIFVDPPSRVCP